MKHVFGTMVLVALLIVTVVAIETVGVDQSESFKSSAPLSIQD